MWSLFSYAFCHMHCTVPIHILSCVQQSRVQLLWQLPVTDLCTLRTYRCDVAYCPSPMLSPLHTPLSHNSFLFIFHSISTVFLFDFTSFLVSYLCDYCIIPYSLAMPYIWCLFRFTDSALLWPGPTPTLILEKMEMKMKLKMEMKGFWIPPCPSEVSARTKAACFITDHDVHLQVTTFTHQHFHFKLQFRIS